MITKPDKYGAPGCYGTAMGFSTKSTECINCNFKPECEPLSAERLAKLRDDLGIKVPKKTPGRKRNSRDSSQSELVSDLPKKVAALIDRFDREGLKITESLKNRENPFVRNPKFMRIACHLLLNINKGFDRQTLTTAYMKSLDWSEGTAKAHVSQVFKVLTHLDAAVELNTMLRIK